MSGTFNPDEPGIFATDDEAVAKAHGLNYFDEESDQWVKRDATEHGDNDDPAREDADEAAETGDVVPDVTEADLATADEDADEDDLENEDDGSTP
jgi:hypothetical protein